MNGVWGYEQQFQDMPDPNMYLFSESTDADGDALGIRVARLRRDDRQHHVLAGLRSCATRRVTRSR